MSKQALIRSHLVTIREMMKVCPEVLAVRADDETEEAVILLDKPEDVRTWADEAGTPLSPIGDRWEAVSTVIDGVIVYAFGDF